MQLLRRNVALFLLPFLYLIDQKSAKQLSFTKDDEPWALFQISLVLSPVLQYLFLFFYHHYNFSIVDRQISNKHQKYWRRLILIFMVYLIASIRSLLLWKFLSQTGYSVGFVQCF